MIVCLWRRAAANSRLCAVSMVLLLSGPALGQAIQPQIWTTNVVAGEFTSQQAAIAAVKAQGGVFVYAEQVEKVLQTNGITTFVYGGKRAPNIGAWRDYSITNGTNPYQSEEAAIDGFKAWGDANGGGCPVKTTVTPTTAWYAYRYWYSGDSDIEQRSYRGEISVQPDCHRSTYPVGASRYRTIACPADLPWDSSDGACVRHDIARVSSKPQPCSTCDYLHNPISVSTGDKYQAEADFTLPWIQFSRHYHSAFSIPESRLGSNWTHSLNVRLYRNGANHAVTLENGAVLPFVQTSTDVYEAIDGSGWRVRAIDAWNGIYQLERPDQSITFDYYGKPTKISNVSGDSLTLQYDNVKRLSTVIHSGGRRLTFDYQSVTAGSVAAGAAPIVAIKQDGVALVNYEYDSAGRLEYARYPDGTARRYHYENAAYPTHLTGISDENNTRYATYGYNADGYATLSEHAGALYQGTFSYLADGTTTYTDANGRVQAFSFTSDGAYRKISQATDTTGVQSTTYATSADDFRRRPLSRIDKRGIQTTYAYSDYTDVTLGDVRKTTTTEAVGTPQSRVTEEWRDRVAGRVRERRTYSAAGVLIQKEVWTYNSRGQVLTHSISEL